MVLRNSREIRESIRMVVSSMVGMPLSFHGMERLGAYPPVVTLFLSSKSCLSARDPMELENTFLYNPLLVKELMR